jgi:hypothetical protein
MVMANARQMGNWRHENRTGRSSTEGSMAMRGMKTVFPACEPPKIQHSNTRCLIAKRIMRVPLQRLFSGSRLRRSITGHPGFNARWARGRERHGFTHGFARVLSDQRIALDATILGKK